MIDRPEHVPDLTRLKLFYAALLLLLGVILVRLWYLQIVIGPELLAEAEKTRTRVIRRVAPRGSIVDVKGRLLATNRPHFVISVLPDELRKHADVLPRLAGLLGMSTADLAALIDQNRTEPFDPVPVADDVTIDLLTRIEEHQPDLPGVLIVQDPKRVYQDNQTCTHVLGLARPITAEKLQQLRSKGYRAGDVVGVEGLEAAYETDLRGEDGGQQIEVNARGQIRHELEELQPKPGRTLRLALDRDLQQFAYNLLREQLARGHPGAVVAMDPNDGAILAFVSTPSYDLNRYGADYRKLLANPNRPLINRVSGSHHPNGSTFKLITAAAGFESGVLTPSTEEYCPGWLRVGNKIVHCDKRSGHGRLGFEDAVGQSCDVYFWRVGQRVGVQRLAHEARAFGLGSRTGIDLPPGVDDPGLVPNPAWKKKRWHEPWYPGDLVNMAIGQGYVGVTPLQLVDYTAALANGGELWRPQIVREVVDVSSGRPRVVRTLRPDSRGNIGLAPEFRDAIVEGMVRAMQPMGTAAASAVPGLAVAGKTGSAQVVIRGQKATHSWFTCFAPVDHPRIALTVMVERAGDGAVAAAPIAKQILMKFFHQ